MSVMKSGYIRNIAILHRRELTKSVGVFRTTTADLSLSSQSHATDHDSISNSEHGSLVQSPSVISSTHIPFSRAKIGPFFQVEPRLGNQFQEDLTLRRFLERVLPEQVFRAVVPDLHQFGDRVAKDIYSLHLECEQNPPRLQTYNAWGQRVDNIMTCPAWKKMKSVAAEEGLVAIAYERDFGQWSRLYQMSKLYLFSPSSGLYSCPLAMTDGAARILEVVGDPILKDKAYKHLISRDPTCFWTSGQWMTERRGGSDVANSTETVAILQSDGTYKLYGYKWFTSATDSDMAIALARVLDGQGNAVQGTRGLSTFYLEVRGEDGLLNNMEVQRLKDKLGTRQLPTAELLLDGVKAYRISGEGRGVASIAPMLTLTRLHNSLAAASAMRRILNFARDYSHKRAAFGGVIKNHSLHIKTMADMEVEARAALLLMLEVCRVLGHEELGLASEEDQLLLRLLTPLAKLYTGKQAMSVISEGLECFGGAGYLEDTGLPLILRDAQVLTIWEGTTNILSLDVLRALAKTEGQALVAFHRNVLSKLSAVSSNERLAVCCDQISKATESVLQFAQQHNDILKIAARYFAFSLARIYIGTLLIEHAAWPGSSDSDYMAAQRWCHQDLCPLLTKFSYSHFNRAAVDAEYQLVMEGYSPSQ